MNWLSDFVQFCLNHGFGGLALLVLGAGVLLLLVLAVLSGGVQAGRAFAKGWREAGPS